MFNSNVCKSSRCVCVHETITTTNMSTILRNKDKRNRYLKFITESNKYNLSEINQYLNIFDDCENILTKKENCHIRLKQLCIKCPFKNFKTTLHKAYEKSLELNDICMNLGENEDSEKFNLSSAERNILLHRVLSHHTKNDKRMGDERLLFVEKLKFEIENTMRSLQTYCTINLYPSETGFKFEMLKEHDEYIKSNCSLI